MRKLVYALLLNILIIELLLYLGALGTRQTLETFKDDLTSVEEHNFSNEYIISFERTTCTTKDLDQYLLPNILVLKVYPQNRLTIEDEKVIQQLESFSYYNTSRLEKDYKAVLQKYGLDEDVEKIDRYGILIKTIMVRSSQEEMDLLKKQFPNLSYQLSI